MDFTFSIEIIDYICKITINNLTNEIIDKVLKENDVMVNDYKNGNERVIKALMGLVMKEAKGKINPSVANSKLKEKLDA